VEVLYFEILSNFGVEIINDLRGEVNRNQANGLRSSDEKALAGWAVSGEFPLASSWTFGGDAGDGGSLRRRWMLVKGRRCTISLGWSTCCGDGRRLRRVNANPFDMRFGDWSISGARGWNCRSHAARARQGIE
jgi:hypothetical protein